MTWGSSPVVAHRFRFATQSLIVFHSDRNWPSQARSGADSRCAVVLVVMAGGVAPRRRDFGIYTDQKNADRPRLDVVRSGQYQPAQKRAGPTCASSHYCRLDDVGIVLGTQPALSSVYCCTQARCRRRESSHVSIW